MTSLNSINAFFDKLDENHKANEKHYLCSVKDKTVSDTLGQYAPTVIMSLSHLKFSQSFGELIRHYYKYETIEELNTELVGCKLELDTNLEILKVILVNKNDIEASNKNLLPFEIYNKSKNVRGVKLNNHLACYLRKELGEFALKLINIDVNFIYGGRNLLPNNLYFKYYKNFDNVIKVIDKI